MDKQLIIDPYVISIVYDKKIEVIDEKRWVIGASIEIGDRLEKKNSSNFLKVSHSNPTGNLNGNFMYVVCSPSFKQNPTQDYIQDIDKAIVQNVFHKDDASEYVTQRVEMGAVSIESFTNEIKEFLYTDDWEYDLDGYS